MARHPCIFLLVAILSSGCGDGGHACVPAGDRRVVTADWLGQSLTLFSYDRLVSGACAVEDTRTATLELGGYAPGPLELEVAPDGRTAVVAVGPGFFGGGLGLLIGHMDPVPEGGTLLRTVVRGVGPAAVRADGEAHGHVGRLEVGPHLARLQVDHQEPRARPCRSSTWTRCRS
ncbi:MAG: hypothetical protein ACOCXM_06405 [Myxococcota bacterium]